MRVWRLTRANHLDAPLSGLGARRAGGRWNSRGIALAYTSTSRPLALIEMLVHVTLATVPDDMMMLAVDVPDELIERLRVLPPDWQARPYARASQQAGDAWVRSGASLGLLVPSAVLPQELNLLINPAHPEFPRLILGQAEPCPIDERLLGHGGR